VRVGDSATYTIQATSVGGDFSSDVALSCSGLPAGIACGFTPARITPGANGGSSKLVISPLQTASGTGWWVPFSALSLPVFGMCLLGSDQRPKRKSLFRGLVVVFVVALTMLVSSCGGGGSMGGGQQSGSTFNITVLGTSGSMQSSTTVQYTMR
jgi:hypothetical protein